MKSVTFKGSARYLTRLYDEFWGNMCAYGCVITWMGAVYVCARFIFDMSWLVSTAKM